jgi:hypothetical protein
MKAKRPVLIFQQKEIIEMNNENACTTMKWTKAPLTLMNGEDSSSSFMHKIIRNCSLPKANKIAYPPNVKPKRSGNAESGKSYQNVFSGFNQMGKQAMEVITDK